MAGIDSEYSFSLTTFSQSGKLFQIEYALAAVENGVSALGIKAKDGVVLATEKRLHSPLMDQQTFKKIDNLCKGVGTVYAGMAPDYKVLLRQGRKRAQNYTAIYGEEIPCGQCTRELANIMQEFTQSGGVRPFGVSMMVAGYDKSTKSPQLFQVDPSGTFFGWKASAIGKNYKSMKTFLEKRYREDLPIEDAIHVAILTLRENAEGALTSENIEVGVVRDDGIFRVLTPAEVQDFLEEAE
ncbi:unnamed protein product [Amoebophrya sp. A120]|nr:unnamed protein product [Amoebophrya sp. A120]|eukprot:GSA120T00022780001.1